jgi:phosphoenolpyruvate carboxykinase (ATP)
MPQQFNKVFQNLTSALLIEHALNNHEAELASNGALNALTGKRTGRSPKDRFIVKDALTLDTVDWGKINQPIAPQIFNALWDEAVAYLQTKNVYVNHYVVGADPELQAPVMVITEYAWHNLFAHNLFIREEKNPNRPVFTILSAPGYFVDPKVYGLNSEACVMLNFTERKILICGTAYAGEMKKAMFTVLNFLLPEHDVLPMHCSANQGEAGDVAIFFGLSGTGKTTLSADPKRHLIGDDEHGWSKSAVFNFEGGCYAKCINLSEKNEPMIYHAIRQGAIMENVVLDPKTKMPDYADARYTENTRVAYPREFIEGFVPENRGAVPQAVIFLTCDLFGVIPPVAILNPEQAAYYFLSGYTALVGSTEMGSAKGISVTFSACFGAPFFPRPPEVYAQILMRRIREDNAQVYLVNTGWGGGAYGAGGQRFSIPTTRSIIDGVLSGDILKEPTVILPGFNFKIPTRLQGVAEQLLDPRKSWSDQTAYQQALQTLIGKFKENFAKFAGVTAAIKDAGPS